MNRPRQIGEREEVIDGQRVKVRVFEPGPAIADRQPTARRNRGEISRAGQGHIRNTRRRAN